MPLQSAKARLICFPHAGAGASAYFRWINPLREFDIELVSIQYPAREDRIREPAGSSLTTMAKLIGEQWHEIACGAKMVAVFGHSMGALLAYEVSRYLTNFKPEALPSVIFLSGRPSPNTKPKLPRLSDLSSETFLHEIEKRYGAFPLELKSDPSALEMYSGILRSDINLVENYTAADESIVPKPISIFGGLDDHQVSNYDLEGWKQYTSTSTTLRMLPGGHFFIFSSQQLLLESIQADLATLGHSI